MFPIMTTNKSLKRSNRESAKSLPLMVMGLIGFTGILVSLVLNEPQISLQAQNAGLIPPNQVLHSMLQVLFF
jgi:hypothetical protein